MAQGCDGRAMLLQNLQDVGFDASTVQHCMELAENKQLPELLKQLSTHKKELLDILHEKTKEIDCLDYLIFTLQKTNHGGLLG